MRSKERDLEKAFEAAADLMPLMPDWLGDSDDDETIEPFFNDTGEEWDNQGDEDDT